MECKINVFVRSITVTKVEQKKIIICYIFQEIRKKQIIFKNRPVTDQ